MGRLLFAALMSATSCSSCGRNDNHPDAGVDGGAAVVTCATLTSSNTCDVTAGGSTTVIEGNVLTPSTIYLGGQVAVDSTGTISCVGCNCAQGGETTVVCADAVISPGLINTHDHITFTQDPPYTDTGERYDDRHQWRLGLDGHTKISSPGGATAAQVSWGEL